MFCESWLIYLLIILKIQFSSGAKTCYFTGTTYYLDQCHMCRNWIKDNKYRDSKVLSRALDTGFYTCTSDKISILMLDIEKNVTLVSKLQHNGFSISGENISLICSTALGFHEVKINTEIKIYSDTNPSIDVLSKEISNSSYKDNLTTYIVVNVSGSITFHCSLNISVKFFGDKANLHQTTSTNIRVYKTPADVHPDSYNSYINEPIKCTGDADPPPYEHIWKCLGRDWKSKKDEIQFTKIGEYNCSCEVKNMIHTNVYTSFWNGTISIREVHLTFGFVPDNLQHAIVGDSVMLSCNVVNWTVGRDNNVTIYTKSYSTIISKTFGAYTDNSQGILQKHLTLDEPGIITYHCSWTFLPKAGGNQVTMRLNITLRVYMAPRNVGPNKDIAVVHGTITCLSEADPPVTEYIWNCSSDHYHTSNDKLKIGKVGKIGCSCSAKNTINGVVHTETWDGVIEIIRPLKSELSNESTRPNTRDSKLILFLSASINSLIMAVTNLYRNIFKKDVCWANNS